MQNEENNKKSHAHYDHINDYIVQCYHLTRCLSIINKQMIN